MKHGRSNVIRAEGGSLKWFKLHHEVMFDSKVQTLPPELFRSWINVLCMASANKARGVLPDIKQVAYVFRTSKEEAQSILDELVAEGLLVEGPDGSLRPHNWEGRQGRDDLSTDRVRKFRKKKQEDPQPIPPTSSPTPETGRNGNETRFGTVAKRDETEMKRSQIRLDETREREEETPPNVVVSAHGHDDEPESVPDAYDQEANRAGYVVLGPDHRVTIEHARAAYGDAFASTVGEMGRDIAASTQGKWECFRAAVDYMKRSGRSFNDPYAYAIRLASKYATHGIPPPPVPVKGKAAKSIDEKFAEEAAEKARVKANLDARLERLNAR